MAEKNISQGDGFINIDIDLMTESFYRKLELALQQLREFKNQVHQIFKGSDDDINRIAAALTNVRQSTQKLNQMLVNYNKERDVINKKPIKPKVKTKQVEDGLKKINDTLTKGNLSVNKFFDSLRGVASIASPIYILMRAFNQLKETISESITKFVEFEKGISKIGTLAVSLSDRQFISKENQKIMMETGKSFEDINQGAFFLISALPELANQSDKVAKIMTTVGKTSVAGLMSVNEAVEFMVSAMNIWKNENLDAERIADNLFNTVRLGKMQAKDYAKALGQASVSADLLGVSIEEVSSAMAILSRTMNVSKAAISFNQMLSQLQKPKAAEKFKDIFDIDLYDKLTGKFVGLSNILDKLAVQREKMTQQQFTQSLRTALPEERAMRSMIRLLTPEKRDGKTISQFSKMYLDEFQKESSIFKNSMENAHKLMYDTSANYLDRLNAKWDVAKISIGESTLGIRKFFAGISESIADLFIPSSFYTQNLIDIANQYDEKVKSIEHNTNLLKEVGLDTSITSIEELKNNEKFISLLNDIKEVSPIVAEKIDEIINSNKNLKDVLALVNKELENQKDIFQTMETSKLLESAETFLGNSKEVINLIDELKKYREDAGLEESGLLL